MKLALKTAPTSEPVTKDDVKKHLRLATTTAEATAYTTEDDLLDRLIATARIITEQEIGRKLITQTMIYYLDRWPNRREIRIPYPPLQSATVAYRLEGDNDYVNTLSAVDVDTISEPGRIVSYKKGSSYQFVVESPTKVKTIKKFLGKDFHVLASMGHITIGRIKTVRSAIISPAIFV